MRRLLAAGALAIGLSACQITATYTTVLAEDGSGTFSIAMTFDEDAAAQPRGVDAVGALFDALAAKGWAIARTEPDDGLRFEATRAFDDPDAFGEVLDELRDTRDSDPPEGFGEPSITMALSRDPGAVQTTSGFTGGIEFGGLGELPPETLAELQRAVLYEIIVDLPGDARVTEGEAVLDAQGRVVWQPLFGEPMTFAASATVREPGLFIAILLGGLGLGLAALAGIVRQRRHQRRAPPLGALQIEATKGIDLEPRAPYVDRTFEDFQPVFGEQPPSLEGALSSEEPPASAD
jgi:hypothetical protein